MKTKINKNMFDKDGSNSIDGSRIDDKIANLSKSTKLKKNSKKTFLSLKLV